MVSNEFPIALAISSLVTIASLVTFIIKKEIDQEYIRKLEVDKQIAQRELEKEKTRQQIIFKAELIAELFAKWLSDPDDRTDLNRLTLQAFLWLPDDIAYDLSGQLNHKIGAKPVRELIIAVRKHLLGETSLSAESVIIFEKRRPTEEASLNDLANEEVEEVAT